MGQWTIDGRYIESAEEIIRFREEDRLKSIRKVKKKKKKVRYKKFKVIKPKIKLGPGWIMVRNAILSLLENKCCKCGSLAEICVDHILPRSKFPQLKCDIENLQLLCRPCNISKFNTNYTDYRTDEQRKILKEYKLSKS